jgi:hypothetical protein
MAFPSKVFVSSLYYFAVVLNVCLFQQTNRRVIDFLGSTK